MPSFKIEQDKPFAVALDTETRTWATGVIITIIIASIIFKRVKK